MAVVFLIGGTGNQLFQYAHSKEGDRFSNIFLSKPVTKLIGWTRHEKVFDMQPKAFCGGIFWLPLVVLDIVIARTFGRSLVCEFDVRSCRAKPIFAEWVRLGYFLNPLGDRDVTDLNWRTDLDEAETADIVLHIRGGDFKLREAQEKGLHLLTADYFVSALREAADLLKRSLSNSSLLILTDDVEYAAEMAKNFPKVSKLSVEKLGIKESFSSAKEAGVFISSNSTLSFWMTRLRGNALSFAPSPFAENVDLQLPESVQRVQVDYR